MDEFCQYNLFRKPRPALFIPPPYVRAAEKETHGERKQVPTLHLRASDPSRMLLLCESLKDQCTLDLETKINLYLMTEGECDCAFLISFQVLPQTAVLKTIATRTLDQQIHVSASDHFLVSVAQNISGVDCSIGQLPQPFLDQLRLYQADLDGAVNAYPIYEQKHKNGIAETTNILSHMVFIVNTTHQRMFLDNLVSECFRFVLPILANTTAYERQTKMKTNMQELVQTGELLFANVNDKSTLIQCIMSKAKRIFECERCDVYLANKKTHNLEANVICKNGKIVVETTPINRGIVGYVFSQNKLLNIKDAYSNPMFMKSDDEKCNYYTRNILCFPLQIEDQVVGCVQIRNKLFGDFNVYDENATGSFGHFVALSVRQAGELQRNRDDRYRQKIMNKLLAYEVDLRQSDVMHLINAVRRKVDQFELPTFNPRNVPTHRIGVMLMKMFEDMGFIKMFHMDKKKLAKFLAMIEKGHFNHPYHNWDYSFAVTQFIYATIRFLQLMELKVLSGLEAMSLLIAAICHNVDHKGVSNSYRTAGDSTFASLYTSNRSVMEQHHWTQTLIVLNGDECNFLINMSSDDYSSCLELIKHNILATDYVEHLKHSKKQEILLQRAFRPRLKEHNLLFCSLLMTCGDFSDQLRDWRTVRNVAAQMYEEYFQQSELETEMGKVPVEITERDKTRLPHLHIDFLNEVCLAPYQLLVHMYSDMQFCVDAIYDNITNWELAKQHFINRDVAEVTSLEMLRGNRLSYTNFAPVEEVEEEENPLYMMMDY